MHYSLSDLMQMAVAEGALAIHLYEGHPPVVELRDTLVTIEGPPLEPGEPQALLSAVVPVEELKELMREGTLLLWHRFSEAVRFRILAFREGDSVRVELRRVLDYEEAS